MRVHEVFLSILQSLSHTWFVGVVLTGVVGYVIKKKIKRMSLFETQIKTMLNKMMSGIEDVFQQHYSLMKDITEVKKLLGDREIDTKMLENLQKSTNYHYSCLLSAIENHRFYIEELISYGESTQFLGSFIVLSGHIELLKDSIEINDAEETKACKERIYSLINRIDDGNKQFYHTVAELKKKVLTGNLF